VVYTAYVEGKANSKQGDVKMKKRELSPIELKKVLELRQLGAKWTEIEQETKVERRVAKRAYEEWERDKKKKEQEAARFRVAAEAFHEHLSDLIRLAGSLATNLVVPFSLIDMQRNAEQFISYLLEQDLLQRGEYMSSHTEVDIYTKGDTQPLHTGGPQFYRREKELLFECLKVHTHEEIRWEDILDNRWKEARDNCAKIVPELPKETSEVVNNYLNEEQETNFLRRIKDESGEDEPVKRMAEVVLRDVWQAILRDKLDEEGPWFQMVSRRMTPPKDIAIIVKSRDETVLGFIGNTNMGLAEKVTHICNLAANNLRKGDTIQQLHREVRKMEKASEELREMLNPVKLRPMILRTRCDLCPA
jgi:hypothetical protein